MNDKDHALKQSLQALNIAYAEKLPARLQEVADALQQCVEKPDDAAHFDTLLQKLHGLSGTAGTFGFAELGTRATELEVLLNDFLKARASARTSDFAPLASGIMELLCWAVSLAKPVPHTATVLSPPPSAPATAARLIYLVHDNALVAKDLAAQFEYFGYEVAIIGSLDKLQDAIDARIPAAVVMDLGFPAGILAGAREIARLRAQHTQHFTVIFISARSSFEARLATVRAGADGYFSKPLDMVALIDRLDALTVREAVRSYRVMIIDDDANAAEFHATVLRNAGMEVRVLRKMFDMLHVLAEFRPELILMDVHLPDCEGAALAKLIRQDDKYLDVPIVFVSNEADIETQLHAIESGADDFLTRPIKPAHLVSALTNRAKRYRELRGLIMRDSLTGLLNHSAIKEQLMREIARVRRGKEPLALAMIDIDHFKRVNDTYGHPVGDQVIRALSRLLQQRLRRGDIIGRYGGEEFAVILPGTPASAASAVLNRIRESFANIRHHSEEQDFTVTFSVGLAELGPASDEDLLFRVADAALYEAKHHGRNCVIVGGQ
jgi:diguanylate cyclase (GGDEF)-like protein